MNSHQLELEEHACQVDNCGKPATQVHGIPNIQLIYTCDEHAERVMLEILEVVFGGPNAA